MIDFQEILWVALPGENAVVAWDLLEQKTLAKIQLDGTPGGLASDAGSHVWVTLAGTADKPDHRVAILDECVLVGKRAEAACGKRLTTPAAP
jgi:hypothetical protein